MIPPSRTTSQQLLLTVGPRSLELEVDGDPHQFETPFDAATFDPRLSAADNRLNMLESRGELLWSAAFSGSLGLLVERAVARADDEGAAITLRVVAARALPSPLRWLPWELLFDPQRRDFLSLKSGWSVIRGVDPFLRMRKLRQQDLRVLVVLLPPAGPGGAGPDEAQSIRDLLSERAPVEIVRVRDAAQLTATLAGTSADIVHVIGTALGEGLQLAGAGGYVGGAEIAAAVRSSERVALVVLNRESTAQVAETVALEAAVTVLAHSSSVREGHAGVLAETFYRRLFDGFPADVALTESRRALDRRFPGERAWTSAVLLTGWPPPSLPRPGVVTVDHGQTMRTDPEVWLDAHLLTKLLHTTNRDRAARLLDIARWDLVERQRRQAQDGLDELDPPVTP